MRNNLGIIGGIKSKPLLYIGVDIEKKTSDFFDVFGGSQRSAEM